MPKDLCIDRERAAAIDQQIEALATGIQLLTSLLGEAPRRESSIADSTAVRRIPYERTNALSTMLDCLLIIGQWVSDAPPSAADPPVASRSE